MQKKLVLLLLATVLLCTVQQSAHAQTREESITISSGQRSMVIRSIVKDGERCISLKDIAAFLSLRYVENAVLRKSELHFDSAVMKFTADNAFVVQT
ncbi:MAG: hypothetical protein AB1600_04355, partial [Bacteroidota bacterium]